MCAADSMQKKIDRADALNILIVSEQQWFELMPELEAGWNVERKANFIRG